MSARKRLPIGIQTFAKIREDNCYYVDKTPLILRLVDEGSHYFLSRPRRFGKSLLLDTIAELFEGNRVLFTGLHAEQHWDWSRIYPVIRISFGKGVQHSRAELEQRIRLLLQDNYVRLGLEMPGAQDISGLFAQLIRGAHAGAGQRVVVLVDEYDKPILDNITEPAIAREMRDGLRNLYSVIKDEDAHIKFAMLTGVSKFSKVSLFSGLNNLRDITVSAAYSAICGYTDEDVDQVFAPELPGLDRDEIRRWYNGYNWTGTSVYNPFDLLLLFQERQFKPYWFETGTPTFLVDLLTQRQAFTPELGQLVAMESLLSSFDVEQISTEALMFQSGYLTIASQFKMGARTEYTLKYPNLEVESSLNGALLQGLTGNLSQPGRQSGQLYRLLLANDFAGLQALFTAFFASIPNDWYRSNPIAQYEGYYASVFYSHFAALGLEIRLEDVTNHGRIDMTVLFNQNIYLFEFKVVELVPEGRALQQIKDRGYADKYRARGEPIHLIGVEFSREQRSVVGFEVETEQLQH
ncbi:ATP-binding protein [Malikia sp.]|uniref:ATP-binding protein n=1 Tax=Malikia sp. TaxID=2070706 RepID=UPI00262CBE87|nr:ATP-binding protein [Malikia sp.]MDD2729559.1 ATP-binding protein [Malikia sp.]